MAGLRGTRRSSIGLIQLGDIIVQMDGAGEEAGTANTARSSHSLYDGD